MTRSIIILLTLCLLSLTGCATKQTVPPHELRPRTTKNIHESSGRVDSDTNIAKKLDRAYRDWAGVPHRDGGYSKKGIDCSGFVNLVFKEYLHKKIPRTTRSLAGAGSKISQQQLQPGDLVLFQIRRGVKHVGIYTGDDNFIHASKSRGVWRSKLPLPYWQDHYWQSRRVLP